MNETEIQIALHGEYLSACDMCLPNYTPSGWWECDFFHLTKAGYMIEHEIKVSRSDFFADAKKSKFTGINRSKEFPKGREDFKHQFLSQGHEHGPREFWFVVPDGLISLDEIPDFAGLKTARKVEMSGNSYVATKVVKKAPFLHKEKAPQHIREHALSVCYYRYWNEKKAHLKTVRRKEASGVHASEEEDARLRAASPYMLKALQMIWNASDDRGLSLEDEFDLINTALTEVGSAIEKATGKEAS